MKNTPKLTNMFNEQSMLQQFKKQLLVNYNEKLKNVLGDKKQKKVEFKTKKPNISKLMFTDESNNTSCYYQSVRASQTQSEESDDDSLFFDHYDIEEILSLKCIAVQNNKLENKRLMMKKMPKRAIQIHMSNQKLSDDEDDEHSDHDCHKCEKIEKHANAYDIRLFDPWINIPPQIPAQNFNHCYGVIGVKKDIYILTDLIQDNIWTPT